MGFSSDTAGTVKRLLMGNDPFQFLGEIVIRTVLVYLALMLAVRLLGKRMSGQITNLELAVMIPLGAIVAVPLLILLSTIAAHLPSLRWLEVTLSDDRPVSEKVAQKPALVSVKRPPIKPARQARRRLATAK